MRTNLLVCTVAAYADSGDIPRPTLAVSVIVVHFPGGCIVILTGTSLYAEKTLRRVVQSCKMLCRKLLGQYNIHLLEVRILGKYDSTIDRWDNIFSAETPAFPRTRSSGNIAFDKGLEWLTENTTGVLDFGCGNGIILFLCALHGTTTHIGIDLSAQAIRNAEAAARMGNL